MERRDGRTARSPQTGDEINATEIALRVLIPASVLQFTGFRSGSPGQNAGLRTINCFSILFEKAEADPEKGQPLLFYRIRVDRPLQPGSLTRLLSGSGRVATGGQRTSVATLFLNPLEVKHECILKRGGLQSFEPARCATVTCRHVNVHDQDVVIGLHVTQFGNPFGGLPVLHL